ncbi:SUKH-4 family immunity protein [Streptomyces sp. NPDC058877]|uniref:SUKH-4 family immunity protein n=1 Tax=unclassified Streptomyces TaxID=2593676 RepID=UPI0036971183
MDWLPYDADALREAGADDGVVEALSRRGLPTDCCRMFVRDPARELSVRVLAEGRAVFLGAFEDGVDAYWLLLDGGGVRMVRGRTGDAVQERGAVNSSIEGLQGVLRVWEDFVRSGRSDDSDGYEDFVDEVVERARESDPEAFADEESWWSRVFEEVELGVLVPEEP